MSGHSTDQVGRWLADFQTAVDAYEAAQYDDGSDVSDADQRDYDQAMESLAERAAALLRADRAAMLPQDEISAAYHVLGTHGVARIKAEARAQALRDVAAEPGVAGRISTWLTAKAERWESSLSPAHQDGDDRG